jgi:hypothetical protein
MVRLDMEITIDAPEEHHTVRCALWGLIAAVLAQSSHRRSNNLGSAPIIETERENADSRPGGQVAQQPRISSSECVYRLVRITHRKQANTGIEAQLEYQLMQRVAEVLVLIHE